MRDGPLPDLRDVKATTDVLRVAGVVASILAELAMSKGLTDTFDATIPGKKGRGFNAHWQPCGSSFNAASKGLEQVARCSAGEGGSYFGRAVTPPIAENCAIRSC